MLICMLMGIATAAPPTLSVDQAIERAMQVAGDLQLAEGDEAIAAGELEDARAALLPALGAEGAATFNSPGANGTQSFVSEDGVAWARATVGLSGSLLGGQGAELRRAHALLSAAHAGTEAARRGLAQGTVDAWYGVALAQAQAQSAQEDVQIAQELATGTALRFTAGEVPEVEVIRTRLLATTRQDELLQATFELEAAAAGLGILIGFEPAWVVPPLDELHGDIEGLVDAAEAASTPALTQAQAQLEAARAGIAAARAAFLPQADYAVGYGFDTDTLGPGFTDHLGLVAGLTVSVPLFDWGVGSRGVQGARIGLNSATIARDQAARAARAELDVASSAARAAAARVAGLEGSLGDAARNVEISLARYAAGEADLVEVTEAQQTLVETRAARLDALAAAGLAREQLRLIAGQ